MLNSAIYQGLVTHNRFQPKQHGFRYKVFMMYLDLDELPNLFHGIKNWSAVTRSLAWFKRSDYYGDPKIPLKQAICELIEQATGAKPRGAIRLLTNMRYFGHCFNPVSFYYCFEADGTTLQAIVSHITNTPWGEDYAYVHDFNHETAIEKTKNGETSAFKFDKQFHVSPFMPMDIQYDWAFKHEANQLFIHMKNLKAGEQIFNASLTLERQEITQSSLNWILIHYPFMTVKVVAAIYWNALLLWIKRVPFYSNPTQVTK
ncbi:MAG: DUF1365 domain-containing protein [Methylotenera sp.]|uniref:DUF1365 domain-containing protein n=1 Tax=Methylotenera sp. TaxID=2051956 RepID=UPI0024884AD9|nr:DUF1365 domain-containing protein [Methylotenera sp.]MDI1309515.1 DUF1365 domain-containing protein [Methylotenera sp.]